VVPDAVVRAVQASAAREIVHRAVELAHREVAMTTPAIQQGMVRRDRQSARERLDRFAILAHAGLGNAQLNDPLHVAWIGGEGALGACNRARVGLRAILDACGRAVLHRLAAGRRCGLGEQRWGQRHQRGEQSPQR
jgi:hypothetical protein